MNLSPLPKPMHRYLATTALKAMGLPPAEVPGDRPSEVPEVTPVEAPPGHNPEFPAEPLPEGEPSTPTELPETPPEADVSAADVAQCCHQQAGPH